MKRKHKHLRVRAFVYKPLFLESELDEWLRELIAAIDMKIMDGPHFCYAEEEINRGWTGIAIIEFSHVSVHIWELENLVELDVFSCKDFDTAKVMEHIAYLSPTQVSYDETDRETDLKENWVYE